MTLQELINILSKKRVAVIGLGVSNRPLIDKLLEGGCDVTVCDKRTRETLGGDAEHYEALGARLRLGETYLDGLDHDIIFRTPGLMPFDGHLVAAQERGSFITSEMEAFFALCPCQTVAVTGSDGKTTTSTIISELLMAAGRRVHLGGNIGHPLLCELPDTVKDDIAVLELSSFQLHSMICQPDIAVVTNISPNHLDKHKDYQDYIDSKMAIFKNQQPGARLVLNLDDGMTPYYESNAHSDISYFSAKQSVENGAMAEGGVIYRVNKGVRRSIVRESEIRLPGKHNVLNFLAAFAATEGLVSDGICRRIATEFAGVEHRLEQVRILRGVTYINDSIGTSPTRTAAGLRALGTKPIVIAGGYDKHIPFDSFGDDLCRFAKRVFLTGNTAGKIRDAILASEYYSSGSVEINMTEDFTAAVLAASASAEEGDIVLLSPGCAAFDRFKDFAERGRYFKKIVSELE